ncbi:hypothetical protein CI109_105877 [Kwoniella shandongensis]|uniref:Uncharacterized protein n=1 Tax=Kwoniella shandongensis TaxID=1734106 RepID=A0A5M6BUQ5_9TREE|nr:uncharacterized protein CI109_005688 [Kwoniella shandongensis]KAA5525941.1 hypothetical protein CI109_005688 [Kwoniella shandongensis]
MLRIRRNQGSSRNERDLTNGGSQRRRDGGAYLREHVSPPTVQREFDLDTLRSSHELSSTFGKSRGSYPRVMSGNDHHSDSAFPNDFTCNENSNAPFSAEDAAHSHTYTYMDGDASGSQNVPDHHVVGTDESRNPFKYLIEDPLDPNWSGASSAGIGGPSRPSYHHPLGRTNSNPFINLSSVPGYHIATATSTLEPSHHHQRSLNPTAPSFVPSTTDGFVPRVSKPVHLYQPKPDRPWLTKEISRHGDTPEMLEQMTRDEERDEQTGVADGEGWDEGVLTNAAYFSRVDPGQTQWWKS